MGGEKVNRGELLKVAKPILFNTEMVQAILEGRKTVTRRVVKLENGYHLEGKASEITENIKLFGSDAIFYNGEETNKKLKSLYRIGDILYVRETFTEVVSLSEDGTYDFDNMKIYYYANDEDREVVNNIDYADDDGFLMHRPFPWKPSIHMPKSVARIFLKVTDVRIERLQDMDVDDAINEGAWGNGTPHLPFSLLYAEHPNVPCNAIASFAHIWDSTVKKQDLDRYGWEANPWVWVIEFERIEVE